MRHAGYSFLVFSASRLVCVHVCMYVCVCVLSSLVWFSYDLHLHRCDHYKFEDRCCIRITNKPWGCINGTGPVLRSIVYIPLSRLSTVTGFPVFGASILALQPTTDHLFKVTVSHLASLNSEPQGHRHLSVDFLPGHREAGQTG